MLLKSFKALHLNEVGNIYKVAHLWKYGTSQHSSRCGIFLLNCCDITWFNTSHVVLYCIYPVKLTDVLNLNVLVYGMFQLIPFISYIYVEFCQVLVFIQYC